MKSGGMIGFEREVTSGVIHVWSEDDRGVKISERIEISVPSFQEILREHKAVDEGTIKWFSGEAQMGAVRVAEAESVIGALRLLRSRKQS